jgi:4-amino-4-deoxy-L-arabinose transferase-like glycosyltransferase
MGAKPVFSVRNLLAAMLAAMVLGICLCSGFSAIGLVGPDEPRYAWIARNMAETGNWVTPILYGQPWFEKPILYYWSAAAGFKLLHSPEWAARLPSSFAALAVALAMAWLAWRIYGARTSWAALFIFSTCVGVVAFARAAAPDMLFSASLALALACAAMVAKCNGCFNAGGEPRTGSDKLDLIFLGAWIGMATLAKGPAGIILAGGAVLLWAVFTHHWRTALRMLHPLAILSFCVVALPWYVLCAERNPGFVRSFILQQNFERYLTPVFQHRQPFWFFLTILLLGLLPWTVLLGGVAADAWRVWRERSYASSPGLFIACWSIFPVVFFSFSQSKLPGYILPAFPPLALLLAHSFVHASEQTPTRARWLAIATAILWLAICASGAHWLHRLPNPALQAVEFHQLRIVLLDWGAATAAAILGFGAMKKISIALMICGISVASLVLYAERRTLQELDPYLSTRALARIVPAPLPTSPREIPLIGIRRSCEYGLRFYRPELPFVSWDSERTLIFAKSFSGYALVGPEGARWLSQIPSEDQHFVRGFTSSCWIEFLHPSLAGH